MMILNNTTPIKTFIHPEKKSWNLEIHFNSFKIWVYIIWIWDHRFRSPLAAFSWAFFFRSSWSFFCFSRSDLSFSFFSAAAIRHLSRCSTAALATFSALVFLPNSLLSSSSSSSPSDSSPSTTLLYCARIAALMASLSLSSFELKKNQKSYEKKERKSRKKKSIKKGKKSVKKLEKSRKIK